MNGLRRGPPKTKESGRRSHMPAAVFHYRISRCQGRASRETANPLSRKNWNGRHTRTPIQPTCGPKATSALYPILGCMASAFLSSY